MFHRTAVPHAYPAHYHHCRFQMANEQDPWYHHARRLLPLPDRQLTAPPGRYHMSRRVETQCTRDQSRACDEVIWSRMHFRESLVHNAVNTNGC